MFGPLILPIFVWLLRKTNLEIRIEKKRVATLIALLLPLGLFIFSIALGVAAYNVIKDDATTSGVVFSHLGVISETPSDAFQEVMTTTLQRRAFGSWTAIFLGFVLFLTVGLLVQVKSKSTLEKEQSDRTWIFVVFLIIVGALLVLGPEFVYLRDQFGYRMNTIFKFYYATWIMWALAAAFATIKVWPRKWQGFQVLQIIVIIPLLIGLLYPVLAIWTKTNQFKSQHGPTLDGIAFVEQRSPGEYEAIQWIQENLTEGTVAEAITLRSSYTYYARVSTYTYLSAVLGWPGHESQWRGGSEAQGSRNADLEKLYTTRGWQEAKNIVDKYGIDYVYIGPLERSTYTPLDERKFLVFMDPIFENGEVTIFALKETGEVP
jgi:uncharacterized membrane protein